MSEDSALQVRLPSSISRLSARCQALRPSPRSRPDSGTVGDGITDASIADADRHGGGNSTVNVYDGATLLARRQRTPAAPGTSTRLPLPDGLHKFTATDYGIWHDQRCVGGHERDARHGGAGGSDHRFVLDRQRYKGRRHYQ